MKTKYFKCLSLIIIALYLHGCGIATVSVYDIGAHVKRGYNKVPIVDDEISAEGDTIPVEIYESDLKPKIGYMFIAYSEEHDRKSIGNVPLKASENKWLSNKCTSGTGEVERIIGDKKYIFKGTMERVNKSTCSVSLEKMERKPYGYPAQALMVLSVPVDAVIIVSFVVASIVATPFLIAYHYLTDAKPDSRLPASADRVEQSETRR
jgi:hypothetical protein